MKTNVPSKSNELKNKVRKARTDHRSGLKSAVEPVIDSRAVFD